MQSTVEAPFDVSAMIEHVEKASTVTVTRDRYGYRIDNEFYRRVTTLCGGIPKPWLGNWAAKEVAEFAIVHKKTWDKLPKTDALKLLKGAPWTKRDDAGDRGTAIHNTIEAFVRGEPIPDGLTDDELACATAAHEFLEARNSRILAAELIVFSPTHGYAGTLDLWDIDSDGVPWILDYKSSANVYADHAVQQVAYQNAEYAIVKKTAVVGKNDTWKGKMIPWGPDCAQRLGIVHVEPEGATLYPIVNTDRLWKVFRAASFTKMWQLDVDSFAGKTPRERVFDDPITLNGETS